MICAPYRRLLAAYVTGTLPVPDARAVASHIGVCPDCAALVVDMMPAAEWFNHASAASLEGTHDIISPVLPDSQPAARKSRHRLFLLITVVGVVVMVVGIGFWWHAGVEPATPAVLLWQEHALAQSRAAGSTLWGPMLSTLEMGEAR